jgi:Thiol:disulfide interchange protein DsbD, N-terminal
MVPMLLIVLSGSVMSGATQHATDIVNITVPETSVESGKASALVLTLTVQNGYHIQAHSVRDEYLVPTTIEARGGQYIALEEQTFPHSKILRLEGSDDPLDIYDGTVEVRLVLKVGEKIRKGRNTLIATLYYQACSMKSCLAPRTLDFVIPIEVL